METSRRFCLPAAVLLAALANVTFAADQPADKLHPGLLQRLDQEPGPAKAWVFFTDKGYDSPAALQAAVDQVARNYDRHAVERRRMRGLSARRGGPLFTAADVPVCEEYVKAVVATGARQHISSRWLNAISVYATRAQAEQIARLPFVDRLEAVGRSRGLEPVEVGPVVFPPPSQSPARDGGRVDYGLSEPQLQQINLVALHDQGYTGRGVVIGILDTGFQRSHVAFNNLVHPLQVIAEYDFVDNDGNTQSEPGDPFDQHDHGTMILGCLGAYAPGSLVGGAYDASFVLCKTEDKTGEYPAEEDNFVAGLEFIEMHGADMSTASLGYIDWYTQADLDGQTAVTTIAVNILTSHGVHHCNAAGNEYHDANPNTSSLIAPADGFQVITCGAADSSGAIAGFSSDGPTADGRVKPEVLALGVGTDTVDPYGDTGYTTASGTSLSTPLVACAVACLTQARPYWTVDQMRQALFETAQYYVEHGTYDPLYVYGYGMVDAYAANDVCSDAGEVSLGRGAYACESTLEIIVTDCGLDVDHDAAETTVVTVSSDSEPAGEQLTLTELGPAAAAFAGTISLSTTDAAGVLLVAEGDTVTVTYIDADDGQGGTDVPVVASAPVDCSPPQILDVQTVGVEAHAAYVEVTTDEPVAVTVRYGLSCGALTQSAASGAYATEHVVALTGLDDDRTYYFAVEAEDQAGNAAGADNGGQCFSFQTPEAPDYYVEQFTSGFDLDGLSLSFIPDGSNDFYAACAEQISSLPTDPTGGTPLWLSDDDAELVSVGTPVWLYGQSYPSLYVGSNGYVTFGGPDTDYSETLQHHFSMPRVSALYDDLNPGAGGTVSYRLLADRFAVTYQNVPEFSASGSNTFQIELYFDGRIGISYLGISADDGIAGLSDGSGLPEDFVAMDLSALGPCASAGDMNCDGLVNFDDIDPFVLALTGEGAYSGAYPDCRWLNADCNADGAVNFDDIDTFVALLEGG